MVTTTPNRRTPSRKKKSRYRGAFAIWSDSDVPRPSATPHRARRTSQLNRTDRSVPKRQLLTSSPQSPPSTRIPTTVETPTRSLLLRLGFGLIRGLTGILNFGWRFTPVIYTQGSSSFAIIVRLGLSDDSPLQYAQVLGDIGLIDKKIYDQFYASHRPTSNIVDIGDQFGGKTRTHGLVRIPIRIKTSLRGECVMVKVVVPVHIVENFAPGLQLEHRDLRARYQLRISITPGLRAGIYLQPYESYATFQLFEPTPGATVESPLGKVRNAISQQL